MKTTYRAGQHVQLGVPNEHSHNLFLSFEEICCRIGLWGESVGWEKVYLAHSRLTGEMRSKHIQMKLEVQKIVQGMTPYANINGS